MNIVIHDLSNEEWQKISNKNKSEKVISKSDGDIKKCIGCFGCWLKTPGQCVIKDELQKMGEWLSKTEKLTVISKCSFGGYSAFVKNVFDRFSAYILPYFEIRHGEMHHKSRYTNKIEFNVVFYGDDITEDEKKTARELVMANSLNFNMKAGAVTFMTKDELCKVSGGDM